MTQAQQWLGVVGDELVRMHADAGALRMDVPGALKFDIPLKLAAPLDVRKAAARVGEYTSGRRTVVLGMFADNDFGEPYAFYVEGDSVVRLYAVSDGSLLSERGELVTFTDEGLAIGGEHLARSTDIIEEQVEIPWGEGKLGATLLLPNGAGPFAATVVVHGAAGGQRDFYRLFAHTVVHAGVAALIFDRPGYGESSPSRQGRSDIFEMADAAEAAWSYLRGLPDIDPGRVGLWGISNGMWAVPQVAARRPEVAFVAGGASSGVTIARAEVDRRTRALLEGGVPHDVAAEAGRAWSMILGLAGGQPVDADGLATLLEDLAKNAELNAFPVREYAVADPMLSPVPPPPSQELFEMLGQARDPELYYDPVNDYRRIRCPVFLQNGACDLNHPVEESRTRIAAALSEAGNDNATIRIYPNAGHLLGVAPDQVEGTSAEQAEYFLHAFRFAPEVLSDLASWLTAVSGR